MQPPTDSTRLNGECPSSPQSADSNSNAPSSSHTRQESETTITPSISLIPIKQEPSSDDFDKSRQNGPVNLSTSPSGSIQLSTATSSSLSSIIKVSPLKSLLREDLKRKIVVRGGSRGRGSNSPNQNPESSPVEGTTNGKKLNT